MNKPQHKAHCEIRIANGLPRTDQCKDFLVDGGDYHYAVKRAEKLKEGK